MNSDPPAGQTGLSGAFVRGPDTFAAAKAQPNDPARMGACEDAVADDHRVPGDIEHARACDAGTLACDLRIAVPEARFFIR